MYSCISFENLKQTYFKTSFIPLSYLVNLSFQTRISPNYLKVAKVNVIHRKEAFDNPSINYRPISIPSAFFKNISEINVHSPMQVS